MGPCYATHWPLIERHRVWRADLELLRYFTEHSPPFVIEPKDQMTHLSLLGKP